jgi:hypothetical protein
MTMANRIISFILILAVAVTATAISPVSSGSNSAPNTFTSGSITIGFFEFNANGVSNRLEIRVNQEIERGARMDIAVPFTLSGITQINPFRLNDDFFEGAIGAVPSPVRFDFSVSIVNSPNIPAGSVPFATALAEGTGTVAFGEGGIWFNDTFIDLNGVVLSNVAESSNTNTNTLPRTAAVGPLEIGFFNFENGRGTHLEIRMRNDFEGSMRMYMDIPYTLSGITRINNVQGNEEILPVDGAMPSTSKLIYTGFSSGEINIPAGTLLASASVVGIGAITFVGEIEVNDIFYDWNGVTITNVVDGNWTPPVTTSPTTTQPGQTTPPWDGNDPNVSSILASMRAEIVRTETGGVIRYITNIDVAAPALVFSVVVTGEGLRFFNASAPPGGDGRFAVSSAFNRETGVLAVAVMSDDDNIIEAGTVVAVQRFTGTFSDNAPVEINSGNRTEFTSTVHTRLLGDVNGDGVVNITDVLEILLYLAGLESVIEDCPEAYKAACLVGETPGITDALEILLHLAGLLPNKIDG